MNGDRSEPYSTRAPSVSLVRATSRHPIPLFAQGERVCALGSGTEQDIVLNDPGVQSSHARIYWEQGRLWLEALPSATVAVNGRAASGPTPVASGDWLTLGQAMLQVTISGESISTAKTRSAIAPGPAATADQSRESGTAGVNISQQRGELTIGRSPENDVRIAAPVISRRHARIIHDTQGYSIEDLGSTNGTFVNGQRVLGRTALTDGERLQFASFAYLFRNGSLHEIEGAGLVRVEARNVDKVVTDAATGKTKRLLAGINLAIEPGEFVAIFGTSGSGKSTLLDALNGRRPASAGSVLYNGVDLQRSFDAFKSTIGYVPQQDIVHRRISIHNALDYTARLRLPEDTSDMEIDHSIERVLKRVGLSDKLWQPIDTPAPLSGGQLKRVSLAIELVANPSILFLDEVTSGLDAGIDEDMMRLFAELATDGKTIVCVTHTLENVDMCSLVLVLYSGHIVYFGPPSGVTEHFGITVPKNVYKKLETEPAERWAERYEKSQLHSEYVTRRLAPPATASTVPINVAASAERKPAPWFEVRQAKILTRRYVDLILADRKTLAVLLAMAPGIGFIFGSVFPTGGSDLYARASTENKLLILMIMTSVFCGCFNSCREVVKELPIYLRERMVNLGIGSYIVSKIIPLAAICAAQSVSLLIVMSILAPVEGAIGSRLLPLFLTGMAATMMGLTVSTTVSKPEMALPIALLISFPQIALANALVELPRGAVALAKVSVIAFWGYDCLKTTLANDVRQLMLPNGQQVLSIEGSYWGDNVALLLFTVVLFATAILGLMRKDQR